MLVDLAASRRFLLSYVLLLCLSACGGGGGGNPSGSTGTGTNIGTGTGTGSAAPPPAAVAVAPTITAQPQDASASVGASVGFSVTATGDAPLSYQWQRNGAVVPGATGAQYVVPAAQFADAGSKWSVVVRNGAGNATSAEARLMVTGTALLAGALQATSFTNGQLVGIAQDGSGNTYLLDRTSADALYKVTAQGVTTRMALSTQDSQAALYQPTGMARDAAGNFYVADSTCAIRKISPAGDITILAGMVNQCGHQDGTAGAATFNSGNSALAVDAANNVFVAEHQAIIRKITPAGVVTTVAGVANAFATVDGSGGAARFGDMVSMTVDSANNLYVTDTGVSGTAPSVRQIAPSGVVTTLAGGVHAGSADGQGGGASFYTLSGLTVDAASNLYVGDQGNHSIRKITQNGVVTTFAGQSSTQSPPDTNPADGPAASATFRQPVAMAIDAAGNIFVAEANPALQFNALRKIGTDSVVSTITGTLAGQGAVDGASLTARFSQPHGVAVDTSGTVWVADSNNGLIRQVSPAGTVTTLAGRSYYASINDPGDGKGTLARFLLPSGIAVDSHGTAYVTDVGHRTVRKVLSDGTSSTLAGHVMSYGAVDGMGTAATFAGLMGITVDRSGVLYVTDSSAVRRIDPASGAVTTLAGQLGSFVQGAADGTGSAATFGYLQAIAADGAGNLYVVDSINNNVRKITPNGVVTTLAGQAGVAGYADGQGTAARFNHPKGIAVDAGGNVYVADTDNDLVRRITPAGVVTTIAGQVGANGNVPGSLNNPLSQPKALAFDAAGVLYVCASSGIFQLHL